MHVKTRVIKTVAMLLALSVLCTSCATPYVWKKTDPDALNRMPRNVATEEHIRRHSLKYALDRDENYYLVEKTDGEKAANYTLRVIGTPVAVAFDVALVCLIAIGGAAAANPNAFNSTPNNYSSYNPPQMYSPATLYAPTQPSIVPIPAGGGLTTYNKVGNTTFGSDGSSIQKVGNTYFSSDGSMYNTVGNTTFGSDGSTMQKVGNTYFHSDGTTYNKVGNTTFGSDGSTIQQVGDTLFYNK